MRVPCDISPEKFQKDFVARRIPVILTDCIDSKLFSLDTFNSSKFAGLIFDDILYKLFENANNLTFEPHPTVRRKVIDLMKMDNFKINYQTALLANSMTSSSTENSSFVTSWTHTSTPNDGRTDFAQVLETRKMRLIRTFLKLSTIVSDMECYDKFYNKKTGLFKRGYEQCIIMDGLWKPPPIPDDLYGATKYPSDWGWLIMSAKNTGSQIHIDPDLMGAWNLLIMGRKWWAVSPVNFPIDKITCDEKCSPGFEDGSNTWPWYQHLLPQMRARK